MPHVSLLTPSSNSASLRSAGLMNPYGPFLGAELAHSVEFGDRRHELLQVLIPKIIDPWYHVAVSQEM